MKILSIYIGPTRNTPMVLPTATVLAADRNSKVKNVYNNAGYNRRRIGKRKVSLPMVAYFRDLNLTVRSRGP